MLTRVSISLVLTMALIVTSQARAVKFQEVRDSATQALLYRYKVTGPKKSRTLVVEDCSVAANGGGTVYKFKKSGSDYVFRARTPNKPGDSGSMRLLGQVSLYRGNGVYDGIVVSEDTCYKRPHKKNKLKDTSITTAKNRTIMDEDFPNGFGTLSVYSPIPNSPLFQRFFTGKTTDSQVTQVESSTVPKSLSEKFDLPNLVHKLSHEM